MKISLRLNYAFAVCFFASFLCGAEKCARPWWDEFPTICQTNRPELSHRLHASASLCGAADDPSWGTFTQRTRLAAHHSTIEQLHERGIKALTWIECFGTAHAHIVQVKKNADGAWITQPGDPSLTRVFRNAWSWDHFDGTGKVRWVGAHNYFDPEEFLGIYTRHHDRYGAPEMRYPDGMRAAGFLEGGTEPWHHRVYHAGCARDVLGRPFFDNAALNALLYGKQESGSSVENADYDEVPDPGYTPREWAEIRRKKFSSLKIRMFNIGKDAACPVWIDYLRASIRQALDFGIDGVWADNFSPWDSLHAWPVRKAFGAWSVAGFNRWCSNNFTEAERKKLGLSVRALTDIQTYLQTKCKAWGGDPGNLKDAAWRDARWLDDPMWRAYLVYKRQSGTQALSRFYRTIKEEAAACGKPDFLVMGNDIPMFSLGWVRGTLDMVSTELNWGWSLTGGSRGLMPPPLGSYVPVYRLAREHAKSRFVNLWFYVPKPYLGKPEIARVLYYQGLASHALPMPHYPHKRNAGTPEVDAAFFKFVRDAAPFFGRREQVAHTGLYFSSSTQLAALAPGGFVDFDNQTHSFSFWGWGTALAWLHMPWRAVPQWKVTAEKLKGLSRLIIPSALVISEENCAQLKKWVSDGGELVIAGECGTRLGEKQLFRRLEPATDLAHRLGVVKTERNKAEKIELIPHGKGQVLVLRSDPGFSFYKAEKERPKLLSGFKDVLSQLKNSQKECSLDAGDAPWYAGLTLYLDGNRLFVDVNNTNIDKKNDSITPLGKVEFTVAVPPAFQEKPFRLEVRSPGNRAAGRIAKASGRTVKVEVENIDIYASCLIEPAKQNELRTRAQAEKPDGRAQALPRITIENGRFVELGSGKLFRLRGFNYIRLEGGWHGTFGPKWYNAERAERMFTHLQQNGFNAVRVFIDFMPGRGIITSRGSEGLSEAYLDNLCDFLKRAARHYIYAIPAFVHFPDAAPYRDMIGDAPDHAAGQNLKYLHPGYVRAKASYMADVAREIKKRDPALLRTVLAFELENETHFSATHTPFSLSEGTFRLYTGETYELNDQQAKQKLADDALIKWADSCRDAVRQVDPEALIAGSVFTFRAVGRTGPGRLAADKTNDHRFPARPLAFARSKVDYVDIHFYPVDKTTLQRDLQSIEFDELKPACRKAGKPLVMGEFGAFKHFYKTADEAAEAMTGHWKKVKHGGFQGFLYWTYDCDEQTRLFNGKYAGGKIFRALAETMEKEKRAQAELFSPDSIQEIMHRVNNWQLAHPWREKDRNWIRATYYTGVMSFYMAAGDAKLLKQALEWAEHHRWQVGNERAGGNILTCCQTYLQLYFEKRDPAMIAPLLEWVKSGKPNAPAAGKVWYLEGGRRYADSLYVGPPALAMLSRATGDKKYLRIMHEFYWDVAELLFDSDSHLFYRDKRFKGAVTEHGKKAFWSRGNGWVIAGLPRILAYLSPDDPLYKRYVTLFKQMANAIKNVQQSDGLWRPNLADPDHVPMKETSGSAFFAYAFAWGINNGFLPREVYLPVVRRAWRGLVDCVSAEGKLGWVQAVGDRPNAFTPGSTHEYAAGAFLLAGSELLKLLEH